MNASILKKIKAEGIKKPFPGSIKPMLCTLTKEPIDDPEYLYEVKWDGYRIISYLNKGVVKMGSRSGLDYTKKYPPVMEALKKLKLNAVVDGEVVVLNEQGKPDFDALQRFNGHNTPLYYYVFDIMYLEGYDLMNMPLVERKAILEGLLKDNDVIRYSGHFDNGPALFKQIEELQMEGIVAKRRDSKYKPNERGKNWYKTPTEKRQEFVIGGWVESDRGRPFATLLVGAYNNGNLEYIAHSGGGYTDEEMQRLSNMLKKLEISKSPFVNEVDEPGTIHWVKPKLVGNFKFATWTKSGKIRKPTIYLGLRKDKNPKDVVREVAANVEKPLRLRDNVRRDLATQKKLISNPDGEGSNWPSILKQKITSEQDFDIGGCTIEINNVEREIWKGITKAELIQYYHSISKYILPHLKDRPQSLHIKPINAGAPGFYIKDMEGHEPECAEIFRDKRKHKKEGKRNIIDYLVCNNESTLLYMVNLGCIDINPWTSRMQTPTQPDYIVIDLDPTDEDFKKVIETAKAAKEFFDHHKLTAFIKTSGKTGMHLLLPCKGFNFAHARIIAEFICREIHSMVPSITTTEVSVDLRGNKLYIDPNQNDYADTIAAAYSVRPFHTPSVSTPLEWKEVNNNLHPEDFTIKNILDRLRKKGDLFLSLSKQKNTFQNLLR